MTLFEKKKVGYSKIYIYHKSHSLIKSKENVSELHDKSLIREVS